MLFDKFQRILVLAPHMDDEVIGCGGSLLKHKAQNRDISIIYFTNGSHFVDDSQIKKKLIKIRSAETVRVCEAIQAKPIFLDIPDRELSYNNEILKKIITILQDYQPDIVYIPHQNESDREHRLVHELYSEAWWLAEDTYKIKQNKRMNSPKIVLEYEVWTPLQTPQYVEDISQYIDDKCNLINLYQSQEEFCAYAQATKGLNRYRGAMQIGALAYAEAFTYKKMGFY